MPSFDALYGDLDPHRIAREVARHDEARMSYRLDRNTVDTWYEFEDEVGDYYAYHERYVSGNEIGATKAKDEALKILDQAYRRRNSDRMGAFANARDGLNSGMRGVCDEICEALKSGEVEMHVAAAFRRHVDPSSWDEKVEIVRQFIQRLDPQIGRYIDRERPKSYAKDYRELIRAYVQALQSTSEIFRRI